MAELTEVCTKSAILPINTNTIESDKERKFRYMAHANRGQRKTYFLKSEATVLGHLDQKRKNIKYTKKTGMDSNNAYNMPTVHP